MSEIDIITILKSIPPHVLTSALIYYYKNKVDTTTPNKLLKDYEMKSNFFRNSKISLRESANNTLLFLDCLPNTYNAVDLSPISPLGSNSIITSISQNNVLSTIRNSEVCADPTTALVLEACLRRKESRKKENNEINMATVTRVVRMQKFDNPHFLQHFSLLALASVYYTKFDRIESYKKIIEHISIYIDFLFHMNTKDYSIKDIELLLSSIQIQQEIINTLPANKQQELKRHSLDDCYDFFVENNIDCPSIIYSEDIINNICTKIFSIDKQHNFSCFIKMIFNDIIYDLKAKYPDIKIGFDLSRKAGMGYYKDICFHLNAKNNNGETYTLADGGEANWGALLLSDMKERTIVSGLGLEITQQCFRK